MLKLTRSLLFAGAAAFLASPAIAQDAPSPASSTPEATKGIGPGARPVGAQWSRSPVIAPHGMAATAQPLATQIALDILKAGGSAVDAAIAANAALGLMEPTGNGIGGDLFAIVWDPKTKQLHGYNGSGRSPKSLTLDYFKQHGITDIPAHGPLPVSVPGTVDAWFALHGRFGRLPVKDLLARHPVYDAYAMACFDDIALAAGRRFLGRPIVGSAEAALAVAALPIAAFATPAAAADDEGDEEANARHAFLAYRHQLNGVQCAEIAMMESDSLDDPFDVPSEDDAQ